MVVFVSDGSYFPATSRAACAWTVESACGSQWMMAAMQVPGPPEYFTSYRSEIAGLLGITLTIQTLASCCRQPQHVIIGCDGEAALRSLKASKEKISANTENVDLISAIVDTWMKLDINPLPVHIKGHQDETMQALTRMERLNILMDKLAKLLAEFSTDATSHHPAMHIGMRQVQHQQHALVGNINKTLYNRLVAKKLLHYFETKLLPGVDVTKMVALSALKYARTTAPLSLNIFHSKWLSDTVATGINMQR